MKKSVAILFGFAIFGMFVGNAAAQWETVWELGSGTGWVVDGVGSGVDVDFVQELETNDPPGNPDNLGGSGAERDIDDDYYFAGTYPDPINTVDDELAVERAFAGADNALRMHFNMPGDLDANSLLRFTVRPNNLHGGQGNSRYGVQVDINGNVVLPEVVVYEEATAPEGGHIVGQYIVSTEFSAGDAGLVGGAGADNVLTLTGINYNDDGGGNWMGMDHHLLEIMPVPEPGGLSMMICGLFWAIPLVCWDQKRNKK